MRLLHLLPRFTVRICIPLIICALVLTSLGFSPPNEEGIWERRLREDGKMNLPVEPALQLRVTSCGPAVIAMAYRYAYPETKITEQMIITYASKKEYYTENKFPFTSPEHMLAIAEHYVDTASTGRVGTLEEGLSLLMDTLTGGDPVIIDILARLDDPDSGAHFVVVTGITMDKNPNKTKIHFNDPLTGTNRWGYWLGGSGVWNAWRNNGDPGGAGWWMVISSP